MKSSINFIIIILVVMSCVHEPQYTIKGNIDGMTDGTVYLGQWINDGINNEYIIIDSAVLTDGSFILKGRVEIPDRYYLSVSGKQSKAWFFLENSEITLKGHVDRLNDAIAVGSSVNDEYNDFQDSLNNIFAPLREFYDQNIDQYYEAKEKGDQEVITRIENQYDSIYSLGMIFQKDYIMNNPASYIAPSILQLICHGLELEETEELLGLMDKRLAGSSGYKSLLGYIEIEKRFSVGQPALDFTLAEPDGKLLTLSSLYGSYLLIDFWASWCGPCRDENPDIVEAYNKYHKKGFDIIGVSLDQDREEWLKAIEEDKLTWHHVSDLKAGDSEVSRSYGVSYIPYNLLLDATGMIIAKNLSGEDLHARLAELLGE